MIEPRRSLSRKLGEVVPVDIGTTSLTALRAAARPDLAAPMTGHPVYETLPLSAANVARMGSDFQRAGFVWERDPERGEEWFDAYGVGWMVTDGNMAPFQHPLEAAGWEALSRHPRPKMPKLIQIADATSDAPVILDPPCPGLLDTCFMLRNGWQFMLDLTENFRVANALLDWALETITQAYDQALDALPGDPDVIVYGDDLGFETGMYLSDLDFRTFIYPRMQTLFARIRARSGAQLCLHSCGAVNSIVSDFCGLGVDMLNLDFYARNMLLPDIRERLPKNMILHAPVNLAAIGQSVESDNRASLALLATDVALAMPCIGGPIDNISTPAEADHCIRGAAFVRALDGDDLRALRELGPVKSIIRKATYAARAAEIPVFAEDDIPLGENHRHDAGGSTGVFEAQESMTSN
jgi:hypothetical protein